MFPAETENNKSNSNKQEQAIWSLKKFILGGKTQITDKTFLKARWLYKIFVQSTFV